MIKGPIGFFQKWSAYLFGRLPLHLVAVGMLWFGGTLSGGGSQARAADLNPASPKPLAAEAKTRPHLADYDAALRLPNGRVDIDGMIARLKELGVTAYYWLIWHAATDWDDLLLFVPKAAQEQIDVWVYIVPPSESQTANYGFSEPFRGDYPRWAEELAKLSLEHSNLKGWVIDDFYGNEKFFTPEYVKNFQGKAKAINPALRFYTLMYFPQIRREFVEKYGQLIDGVIGAYPSDAGEIEEAWAILNDAPLVAPAELSLPYDMPTRSGDFVALTTSAKASAAAPFRIVFESKQESMLGTVNGAVVRGPKGYEFKQLLVNQEVAWEEDVAEGNLAWAKIEVDIAKFLKPSSSVKLAFRLIDKKAASNFPVQRRLDHLTAQGLELSSNFRDPSGWKVDAKGPFKAIIGPSKGGRAHHLPFIVMTSGNSPSFKMRHGDGSPEKIASHLAICLSEYEKGKCDGVVMYSLEKEKNSNIFPLVKELLGKVRTQNAK
jgi:hypothetical protein